MGERRSSRKERNRATAVAEAVDEPRPEVPDRLRVTDDVMERIRHEIGMRPAEFGGALGGDPVEGVVRHFEFDPGASRSRGTWSPDVARLNQLFKEEWNPRGIRLMGFVHSHPGGIPHPSGGDEVYARAILEAVDDMGYLMLPIVMTEPDTGCFEMSAHVAVPTDHGVRIQAMGLDVIDEDSAELPAVDFELLSQDPFVLADQLRAIQLSDRLRRGELWPCGHELWFHDLCQGRPACTSVPAGTHEPEPDLETTDAPSHRSHADRRLQPPLAPPFHYGPIHPGQRADRAGDHR